jgi:Tfp pilus assembly protein PilX
MQKPMHRQRLKRANRSRGVALITALLLLSLLMVMTLSMVIATTSDTLIDGYYRNARGSFYAADSGINAARQYMMNQFTASIPNPYTPYSGPPISSGAETTILSSLNNTTTGFGAYQSVIGTQSSWKGSFIVDSANTTLGAPTCQVHYTSSTGTIPTCTSAGNGSATWYQYSYPYKITVIGRANASATNTVQEQGTILLTATITSTSSTTTNFAAYGMFIDQSPICNGSTLVPGTISGPVFTNGAWNFGTSGSYIFTDAIGSHSSNIGYNFSSCIQSPNTSYTSGSQTIHPTFQSGITLGASTQSLPADSYNQARAVIDGEGTNDTQPSNAELNAALKNVSKAAYPTTGASSGVYLPYSVSGSTNTMTGGGIYVEGNATVTITASGSSAQVYTIVQGSTTTTVTIDTSLNQTTIQQSGVSGTTTITGVPVQKDSSGNFLRDATMLYVDGNITALKGGGQGVGTIQDSTALNVVANGSVTITGDILYKSEPVTLTQSGSTPADTLIPANNHGQSLGIYTSNGNINLANAQSNGNLEIDASLAAIASNQSYTLVNTGNAINTLTIVGGRIQDALGNINTTTRNVWFDRRYAQGGFAPPWFPSTTSSTTTTTANPVPQVTASRTSWVNTTAQ